MICIAGTMDYYESAETNCILKTRAAFNEENADIKRIFQDKGIPIMGTESAYVGPTYEPGGKSSNIHKVVAIEVNIDLFNGFK